MKNAYADGMDVQAAQQPIVIKNEIPTTSTPKNYIVEASIGIIVAVVAAIIIKKLTQK